MTNPASQMVEARGSDIQEHHRLQSKFKVILDYMRPCIKKQNKNTSAVAFKELWTYTHTMSKIVIKKLSNFMDDLY